MLPRIRIGKTYSSIPSAWQKKIPIKDEADWRYAGEWWGSQDGGFGRNEGHAVFQQRSLKGNGLVSVTAHPASFPTLEHWSALERQLQQKYERLLGARENHERVRILDYQWRVLRFNNVTRESVAKVMFVCVDSDPGRVFLVQQPHCLAFPYVKSMVSIGLTTLASTSFDLTHAIFGSQKMRILCIGNGGGTIPLFLANKIKGAVIDVVEIDEAVISASRSAMGFPAVLKTGGSVQHEYSPHIMHKVLWDDIQERLFLYEADGEAYLCNSIDNGSDKEVSTLYDLVFIDAYDGDDIFPYKFRARSGPFLTALQSKVHPEHGTVIVNLHLDASAPPLQEKITSDWSPTSNSYLPLGRQNLDVCRNYRDALTRELAEFTLAFTVTTPFLQNLTLVVTKGIYPRSSKLNILDDSEKIQTSFCLSKDQVLKRLMSESQNVEKLFDLPFDCSQFVRRGFFIIN